MNEIAEKFRDADGLVLGTPVYYSFVNGTLESLLQRLFYSSSFDKTMKVGASVVIARRGGCSATFDALNKFFTISGMPVVSSQYWNSVHGVAPGDAKEDAEGIQTVRVLARNMTFLMKSIALGREKFGLPGKKKITFGQISSDGLLNYTAAKNRLFKIEFHFPQFFSSQGHS